MAGGAVLLFPTWYSLPRDQSAGASTAERGRCYRLIYTEEDGHPSNCPERRTVSLAAVKVCKRLYALVRERTGQKGIVGKLPGCDTVLFCFARRVSPVARCSSSPSQSFVERLPAVLNIIHHSDLYDDFRLRGPGMHQERGSERP